MNIEDMNLLLRDKRVNQKVANDFPLVGKQLSWIPWRFFTRYGLMMKSIAKLMAFSIAGEKLTFSLLLKNIISTMNTAVHP